MNPLDTISRIIQQGKSGALYKSPNPLLNTNPTQITKEPVKFDLNLKPTLPMANLGIATPSRQIVAPVPVQVPQVAIPKPPISPLDIIRMGKEQAISQGMPQTKTSKFSDFVKEGLVGNEQDRAYQADLESRGINPGIIAKTKAGGVLGLIAPSLARTTRERQTNLSNDLIKEGTDENKAIEIAYHTDIIRRGVSPTQTKEEFNKVEQSKKALEALKLTQKEKNVLLLNKVIGAGETALDVTTFGVGGLAKNVGKGVIKTVLKNKEIDLAEQVIDIARGTSKLDKQVQKDILQQAQNIADREVFPNRASGVKALANDFEAALQNKTTENVLDKTVLKQKPTLIDEPKIRTKTEVFAKDVAGNKFTVPAGTKIVPQTDGKKFFVTVEGKEYVIPKNQYDNLKGQSDIAIATKFAPELKGTVETVKGATFDANVYNKYVESLKAKYDPSGRMNMSMLYDELPVEEQIKFKEMKKSQDTVRDFGTKYSQYTLPNGENYREILIQAPNKNADKVARRAELRDIDAKRPLTATEQEEFDSLKDFARGANGDYQSSHWSEPNVISHIRMNERTVGGKKYAFMEELQSDWARDVRNNAEIDEQMNASNPGLNAKSKLPDNPLLKNWQIPTTKRALIEAVDSGADRFSWINGEQTSARYNLATHLDSATWKTDLGDIEVSLKPKQGGSIINFSVGRDGTIFKAHSNDWNGKKLDEVLGKGLADKIMEKETGTLSGEGLSFGGEWAKNLYDRQVRDIVKKLTGAEVKTVDLGLGTGKSKSLWSIQSGPDAGGDVTVSSIRKGMVVTEGNEDWIVVDLKDKDKFLAIQPSDLKKQNSSIVEASYVKAITDGKYSKNDIQEFSLKTPSNTGYQQYIDLTPEVKARIQSESPKFKLAPDDSKIPLIYSTLLNVAQKDSTIARELEDFKKIFGTDNAVIKGVPFFDEVGKLGEMNRGVINLLEKNGKVSEAVAKHEMWHLYKTGMVTKAEKATIVEMEKELLIQFPKKAETLRKAGYKEAALAEELMADEFSRYYRTGRTFSQKLAVIFDRLIQRIEMIFKNKTEVLAYFKNVSKKNTGAIKGNAGVVKSKLNPIDKLIASNKVRVVSRDGRDVYQVKKGKEWANVRDEDSAIRQASFKKLSAEGIPLSTRTIKKPIDLPQHLEERLMSLDISKEALALNPAKQLSPYVSKRGDSKGLLAEVTGRQKSKTGFGVDVRAEDLGYKSSEEARNSYEQYVTRKTEILAEEKAIREDIKIYRATEKLREKTAIPAKAVDQIREIQKIAPEQVRSLEEVAQQLDEVIDLPPRSKPVSLEKIITQTPVNKKVNIFDYIRTPDRVLNKMGFGKEAQFLRNQYEKYVIELPKNIDTISAWVKRVPDDASPRIFDYLDGKNVQLSKVELEVANEIKDYLKTWANRLGLPEDNRVTNYITHLFDAELIAKEFDEDLAKIIADKIPGEVYNPFLEKRLGAKGYKRDVWGALDAYTKRATRKVHIDPALERIRDKAGASLEFTNLEETQFKYIQTYISQVQQRPTYTDNLIDNAVKSMFGYKFGQRPVVTVSRLLRQMTYRGMLGGNLSSALRNLSQGINTYATLGEKYTVIGYSKLFSTNAKKELAREGVLAANFIEDRALSSTKKTLQKIDKSLWFFFDQAEKVNRGAAYFGAKAKGLNKGMDEAEAIIYAKNIVRKTQFAYDNVDSPVLLGSDIMKTLLQFQTFTVKQTEFLGEMIKDKNFVGLLRYAIAGYAFVNTVGLAFGMKEKELIPYARFDVPPSLKFPWEVTKAVLNSPDAYGNIPTTEKKLSNIGKSFMGLVPAGSQIKKSYEGYKAVKEGGSFNAAGRKQFDQGTSKASQLQSILFGKYASQNASNYFDKKVSTGNKELDKVIETSNKREIERTKEAPQLLAELKTLSPEEANARLKEIKATDEALFTKIKNLKVAEDLNWSKEEKAIASLGVTNGTKANYVYRQVQKLDTPEAKNAYLKDLLTRKIISKEVLTQIKELKEKNVIIE